MQGSCIGRLVPERGRPVATVIMAMMQEASILRQTCQATPEGLQTAGLIDLVDIGQSRKGSQRMQVVAIQLVPHEG